MFDNIQGLHKVYNLKIDMTKEMINQIFSMNSVFIKAFNHIVFVYSVDKIIVINLLNCKEYENCVLDRNNIKNLENMLTN